MDDHSLGSGDCGRYGANPIRYNTITLRPATRDDIDHLFAVHRAALMSYVDETWGWDDTWQARYFRENFDTSIRHVVCCGNDDIGFLDRVTEEDGVILENIELSPEYQGGGIGTRRIRRLIKDADSVGLPIRLRVLKVNARARALYERLSFELKGRTETHYQMERPSSE